MNHYVADCIRYLIGELEKKPRVTDYDTDKHSGYVPKKWGNDYVGMVIVDLCSDYVVGAV